MKKIFAYILISFFLLLLGSIKSMPVYASTTYTCDIQGTNHFRSSDPINHPGGYCASDQACRFQDTSVNTPPCLPKGTYLCDINGKNHFFPPYTNNGQTNSYCTSNMDCPYNTTKVGSPPCVPHGSNTNVRFTCDDPTSNRYDPSYYINGVANNYCASNPAPGQDCPYKYSTIGSPPCVTYGDTSHTTFICDDPNSNHFYPDYPAHSGNFNCKTNYDCPNGTSHVGSPNCIAPGNYSNVTFTCDTSYSNHFSPPDNGNSNCSVGFDCPNGKSQKGSPPCVPHVDTNCNPACPAGYGCVNVVNSTLNEGGLGWVSGFLSPLMSSNSIDECFPLTPTPSTCSGTYDCGFYACVNSKCTTTIIPTPTDAPTPNPLCENDPHNPNNLQCQTALGIIPTQPAAFIAQMLVIILSFAGGIAVLLILNSGYHIMMSQGNPDKLQEAREGLTSALVGLLFIIFSVAILQLIAVNILRIPGFTQ